MNQTAMLTRFLRDTDVDAVLCAGRYTLLDQSALAELLPEAAARGRAVVVGGVFNSGLLADPRPGATYDYAAAPDDPARPGPAHQGRHRGARRTAARRRAALPARSPGRRRACSSAPARRTRCTTPPTSSRRAIPDAVWDDLRAEGLLTEDPPDEDGR